MQNIKNESEYQMSTTLPGLLVIIEIEKLKVNKIRKIRNFFRRKKEVTTK